MELNNIQELLGADFELSETLRDRHIFFTGGYIKNEVSAKLVNAGLEFDIWRAEFGQLSLVIMIKP